MFVPGNNCAMMPCNQNDSEVQKQQARALIESLDDEAIMRLAWRLHERSLLDINCILSSGVTADYTPGAAGDNGNMCPPPNAGEPVSKAFPPGLIGDPVSLSNALPVGPVLYGTGFASQSPASASSLPSQTGFVSQSFNSVSPPAHAPATASPTPTPGMPAPSESSLQSQAALPLNAPPGSWVAGRSVAETAACIEEDSLGGAISNTGVDEVTAQSDEKGATTLILRNFPEHFDQQTAQEWVDQRGYEGKYDFFLWFPPKAAARQTSGGYAFVNFREPEIARRCLQHLHLSRFADTTENGTPLNVAVAKVQGFAANYSRFHHMLDGNVPTRCSPYFAQESIDALSQAELAAAREVAASDGPTTIVIRNLPASCDGTTTARRWLDIAGYSGTYDFLIYLPSKKNRQTPTQGDGYAFVNFKRPQEAMSCMDKLNGTIIGDSGVPLNIVAAKIQGLNKCIEHFSSLTETGRCVAWTEPQETAVVSTVPSRISFQ